MTGGPGGGSPIAVNGSARKALMPASPIRANAAVVRRDCLIFLLLITFISFLFWPSFDSSFLRTQFQPFTCSFRKFCAALQRKWLPTLFSDRGFETRVFPNSLAATHRGFTFYVADPISSIHGFHGWEL